jgi:hypothetical protein
MNASLFEGDSSILGGFYSGQFSKMGVDNQKTAERLMNQASKFAGEPVTLGDLKKASLVVGDDHFLRDDRLFGVTKHFVRERLRLSSETSLAAELLLLVPGAHLSHAELLKDKRSELRMSILQDILKISFNSGYAGKIQSLVRAARRLLSAA